MPADLSAKPTSPASTDVAPTTSPSQPSQVWPRAVAVSALGVAVVAVGLAGWALVRPMGEDPVAVQAVAANARLSMATGGPYLLAHLDSATPSPLAGAIRSFAGTLQDIAMNTLAGVPNGDPAQAARLGDAQKSSVELAALCKG